MISFTEAQIVGWLTPLLWPFIRAMAMFQAMPVMGTRAVPMRVRIGLSVFLAIASQGTLPPLAPEIAAMSLSAPPMLLLIAQQVVIQIGLGRLLRIHVRGVVANLPGAQQIDQRGLVHHAGPRRVHEDGARLELA